MIRKMVSHILYVHVVTNITVHVYHTYISSSIEWLRIETKIAFQMIIPDDR